MHRVTAIKPAGEWNPVSALDRVVLDAVDRLRRRIVLTGERGTTFLLDLAKPAALAARCAGEQGKYWQMHDRLFEKQAEWVDLKDPGSKFKTYARDIGIAGKGFAACYDGEKYSQEIEADVALASKMKATGTHDAVSFGSAPDYSHLDVPAVVRKRNVTVEALANSGVDRYDIPAFLRKQAD